MTQSAWIFSRHEKVYGLTFQQWCLKWWLWLLGIPKSNNPASDMTGGNAKINQDDSHVFYLCQTLESNHIIPIRTVTIPKGRSIFMPVINWISTVPDDGTNDEELIVKAKRKLGNIGDLKIKIDGIDINLNEEDCRVTSGPFDVILSENNILNLNPGPTRVYSDGYWIMTRPINFPISVETHGSCSSGSTRIGVYYDLLTT